jgi:hypothetical protein
MYININFFSTSGFLSTLLLRTGSRVSNEVYFKIFVSPV